MPTPTYGGLRFAKAIILQSNLKGKSPKEVDELIEEIKSLRGAVVSQLCSSIDVKTGEVSQIVRVSFYSKVDINVLLDKNLGFTPIMNPHDLCQYKDYGRDYPED